MKTYPIENQLKTLNEYERTILDSVENNEWMSNYESTQQFEIRKAKLMKAAQNALSKISYEDKELDKKEIIIQIPQNLLERIQKLSRKSGIDYQKWIVDTLQRVMSE